MSNWFQERYILRSEHQEIVGYYRKLLAQLHITVRDLRDQLDAQLCCVELDCKTGADEPTPIRAGSPDWSRYGANVVSLDRHRVSRTKH